MTRAQGPGTLPALDLGVPRKSPRYTPPQSDTVSIVVCPDLQVPYHNVAMFDAWCAYVETRHWDICINIGDLVDLDVISKYNVGLLRKIEGKTLEADFAASRVVLDRMQKAARRVNPACEVVLIEGNHEFRIERYLDLHPELRGILNCEAQLDLDELDISWVPSWSKGTLYKVGPISFMHGDSHGKNHARQIMDRYRTSVFYGHVNNFDQVTSIDVNGKLVMTGCCGHMCDETQIDFIRNKPMNWQAGFREFYVSRWAFDPYTTGPGLEFSTVINRMARDGSFIDSCGRLRTSNG